MTEEEFMSLGDPVTEDEEIQEDVELTDNEEAGEAEAETVEEETGEEAEETQETTEEAPAPPAPPQINPEEARLRADAYRQKMEYEQEFRKVVGKMNPYRGTVISAPEEYEAYKIDHANAKQQSLMQRIQQGTATADELQTYVQSIVKQQLQTSPEIQRAQMAAQKAEQAERLARIESGKNRLQADIDALNKEYPSCGIKSAEDIKDPAIVNYMRRGLSVSEAYYLTHRAELAKKQQEAAKQAVINQANSKNHLKTIKGGTGDDAGVTEEMIESFRPYYPNTPRTELVKKIKKYMKE